MKKLIIGLLSCLLFPVLANSQVLEEWGGVKNVVSHELIGRFEKKLYGETLGLYMNLVYAYDPRNDEAHRFLVLEHCYALSPCPPLPNKGDKVWIKWIAPEGKEKIGTHECLFSFHEAGYKYMVFDGEFYDGVITSALESGKPMAMTKIRYLAGGEPADFEGTESVGSRTFAQNLKRYYTTINSYLDKLFKSRELQKKIKENPTYNF